MTWTANNEREYAELEKRMTALAPAREQAISHLLDVFNDLINRDGLVSTGAAIKNAGRLRDALAPFDIGIRAEAT